MARKTLSLATAAKLAPANIDGILFNARNQAFHAGQAAKRAEKVSSVWASKKTDSQVERDLLDRHAAEFAEIAKGHRAEQRRILDEVEELDARDAAHPDFSLESIL